MAEWYASPNRDATVLSALKMNPALKCRLRRIPGANNQTSERRNCPGLQTAFGNNPLWV